MDFLTGQREWSRFLETIEAPPSDNLSPGLTISRIYMRFEKLFLSQTPHKNRSQKLDTVSALTESFGSVVPDWAEAITDIDQKLIFELHLEGLVDEEISALFQMPAEEVSLLISSLKSDLKNDLEEGELGT